MSPSQTWGITSIRYGKFVNVSRLKSWSYNVIVSLNIGYYLFFIDDGFMATCVRKTSDFHSSSIKLRKKIVIERFSENRNLKKKITNWVEQNITDLWASTEKTKISELSNVKLKMRRKSERSDDFIRNVLHKLQITRKYIKIHLDIICNLIVWWKVTSFKSQHFEMFYNIYVNVALSF